MACGAVGRTRAIFQSPDMADAQHTAPRGARPRTILIWQRNWPSTLGYMYRGIVATLLRGFSASINGTAPSVIVGAGKNGRSRSAWLGNVSALRPGDVVIWVGAGFNLPNWDDLGRRGLTRVHYQTEAMPRAFCVLWSDQVDELVRRKACYAHRGFDPRRAACDAHDISRRLRSRAHP